MQILRSGDDEDESVELLRPEDDDELVTDAENENENENEELETKTAKKETNKEFWDRQYKNLMHFLVEDWFISAMLGIITAILSISIDVGIELLIHLRNHLFEISKSYHESMGFVVWVSYITFFVWASAIICYAFGKQAVGSGIPEVKVIIHGFKMKNYLSLKTLIAKVLGLTLAMGSGLPIGKEGPFVHIGAIVASLLNKATSACRFNSFFSNEGRSMEMLSIGCAVGIACTFSAPMGAVLYGIESTSKYFAVKNYWRSFFATTCSALIFRFALLFFVPPHIAGTIMAYYQTNFPNEVFVIEEIGFFVLLGVAFGLLGALFVYYHRRISLFKKRNRAFKSVFGNSPISFTVICAALFAVLAFPDGFGTFFAGKMTFHETLVDFIANCTFTMSNVSNNGCPPELVERWTSINGFHPLMTLSLYFTIYFLLVPICIGLFIPSGIFVPCFVIGACGGRIAGELIAMIYPDGFHDETFIYPGLYAVVGAAAFTGSVTHSLSIALIVCETTGQLCALLPVLISLMISNAICSFLQPSIYESIIKTNGYPYLADLPPSRISVHQMKIEQIMIKDIVYITRDTTYWELREILLQTPNLRSYPFVTDKTSMTLLGSVARKYLVYLIQQKLGSEADMFAQRRNDQTSSELFISLRQGSQPMLTDRSISGSTLLPQSLLHDDQGENGPLASLLYSQNEDTTPIVHSMAQKVELLSSKVDLIEVAIDPAPFQLVRGTSLYKVHTLFSLLALNHAYVTEKGRLVGVVSVKELRETLNNIYSRGAVAPRQRVRPINDEENALSS
ncbi:unnamed protein product [Caenorhabditis angaria]|uniref:Chloride channel protein n=1 Tax=Caenorhabditis angaria TaxID=860376 RepID=A0A9P1MWY8_9PELO|nr:unnamed protein product [Caenorhabditis angaria]